MLQFLQAEKLRIAAYFIDPLLDAFEAANHFYFQILSAECLPRISCYRSGAGPLQALADARELIDGGLCDAVFIFGYEPLREQKRRYGAEAIARAMDIFPGEKSILACYNELARDLSAELRLDQAGFFALADALYQNYGRTFLELHPAAQLPERGRSMAGQGGELFRLTDCANPNVNFAGGIIVASAAAAERLEISPDQRLAIRSVHSRTVAGAPARLKAILGSAPHFLPHLQAVFQAVQHEAGVDLRSAFHAGRLRLDLYTCYPPIPLAALWSCGLANSVAELFSLLATYPVTLTGGLSLAGAPWNNPVLNSFITLYQQREQIPADYFLIHANGGIGEMQGLALFTRA
jgi:hypothetical protein